MLMRVLEPEVMDDREEASEYDSMDHSAVNDRFVTDLLAAGPIGTDLLDVGTGTALIPVLLCQRDSSVRVMASDASVEMLELARYHLEGANLVQRIQLNRGDAKKLIFQNAYFDCVFSNSLVHHLPTCESFLSEMLRVLRPGGLMFIRDLHRPESDAEVESLVATYASGETDRSQQLLRQSLHASLTVAEVQSIIEPLGIDPQSVSKTSDRHWTLSYRKT